jgi:hypothetical protein
MSDIETYPELVRFSKQPSCCIELIWASGNRVLALPTVYLSSACWTKIENEERVSCEWGGWVVTLVGHGLQRIPGCLIRGEICAISELESERAEVITGTVVNAIDAVRKKSEE